MRERVRVVETTSPMMATKSGQSGAKERTSWRPVALPVEHGGWSLLLEPVFLGLALRPSRSGLFVALAALAAFLARHPLRLLAMDHRKGMRYPRTALAGRFVVAYGACASIFLVAALETQAGQIGLALLAASPVALAALAMDLLGRGRELWAEASGSVALSASVMIIVVAGGGHFDLALMAWLLQGLRAATAVVYVRARLRRERGIEPGPDFAIAIHAAALVLVLALSGFGLVSPLAVPAFALLLARAAWGLLGSRTNPRAQAIGIQEVVFGLVVLFLFVPALRPAA